MASNMRTSRAGLDVIKAFEGFRPRYQELPDGRWIIGYGHVRAAREGVRVSEDEAEAILREYDLPPVERLVMDCLLAPLNQNEFDALVSLAYNIGAKGFVRSDIVAHINAGNRLAAAGAFDHWRQAKIGGRVQVVDALVRRRATEKALFLKAPGSMPVASSRLYFPVNDKTALPAPARPREIVVEHASAAAPRTVDPVADSARIATEEAAESIKRRLVRIVGEDGSEVSDGPEMTDGASPEEITAAISALAGEPEDNGVQKSVWPQREDLPPPPHLDDEMSEAVTSDVSPNEEGRIDDLEEVEISDDDIRRAVAAHDDMEAEAHGGRGFEAAPFGILSLIGAGLAGFGVAKQFGVASGDYAPDSGLAAYLSPFLMLLGGLLFVTMGYYFFRTLFGREG